MTGATNPDICTDPSAENGAAASDGPTVLAFSDQDDHCTYRPQEILQALSASERAVVDAMFPDALQNWTSTASLHGAVDALQELGHRSIAAAVATFLHEENVFGCQCATAAFDKFRSAVDDLFWSVEAGSPYHTWWTPFRTFGTGLDLAYLLAAVDANHERSNLTVTLDASGNGTLVTDTMTLRLESFAGDEGEFLQALDCSEILAAVPDEPAFAGVEYATCDDWFSLPAQVRSAMAKVYCRVVRLAAGGVLPELRDRTFSTDLSFGQLQRVAEAIVGLPIDVSASVLDLLSGWEQNLEDLIDGLTTAAHAG